jgi:hypothetical protein
MGLNTFLWAFAAGYPCVIFGNQEIRSVVKTRLDGYLTIALSLLVICTVVFVGWRVSRSAERKLIAAKKSPEPRAIGRLLTS